MNGFIICMIFFQVKHLIVDFFLQPEYMWKNKGTFMHPGGILHSVLHALATMAFLEYIDLDGWLALWLVTFEFVAHYAIDFSKMNINRVFEWTPMNSKFWYMLGLDQFLHQACYVVMIYFITTGG